MADTLTTSPTPVRLLEIVGISGPALSVYLAIADGERGASLAFAIGLALVSIVLILLITRRRSGTAWVVVLVLAILCVPYWLLIVGAGVMSHGAANVLQAIGLLGFVSPLLSVATIALLTNKEVRSWKG